MRMFTRLTLGCFLAAALAPFSHAQGVAGSGISSGVAGGITAGGLGGGGVGTGTTGGVGGNQGIGGSNAAQGLTGSRETVLQSDGFLNQNSQNGGGFLGQGANNQNAGGFGNAGGFNAGGRGGFGGGGQQGAQGRQPQTQQPTRILRTKLTIAPDFTYPRVTPTALRAKLNGQFQRVRQLSATESARVSKRALGGSRITSVSNDRTVTLRGTVASERDRLVAEKLAKMEPGVDSVVNELTVAPQ